MQNTFSGNSPNVPSANFKVGTRYKYGGSNFYNGYLDELAIWDDTAITPAQVVEIYNSGVPNNLNDLSTPPPSWWRNGDPNGQASFPTIVDDGSNSNSVEMTNMTDTDIETEVP